MRLLFARVGRTFCRQCGQEVVRETAELVAKRLGDLSPGTRLLLGFEIPVVADAPRAFDLEVNEDGSGSEDGEGVIAAPKPFDPVAETINTLRRRGFGRLLIDGKAVPFEEVDSSMLAAKTRLEV